MEIFIFIFHDFQKRFSNFYFNNKKLKIYVENSVIGGYFDKEFEKHAKRLFEEFKRGTFKAVISSHVMDELGNGAPQHVIGNLKQINYDEYELTKEMIDLADKYMESCIVTKKYYEDGLHIAIATVIGVDVLVSWNFKHIVNLNKIKLFNHVNLMERYLPLEIRTPPEVLDYE
ncbi:MAG: hypothetical protein LBT10_06150 [Methanobrevibacter sp.]|nr:hypothetical protein [Methanobrevibacter sp.]